MGEIVETTKRRKMRARTYLWMLTVISGVFASLYWEQTKLLFVTSTLAMCVLPIVVALADLEGRDRASQFDEAATAPTFEGNEKTVAFSSVLAKPLRHKDEGPSLEARVNQGVNT